MVRMKKIKPSSLWLISITNHSSIMLFALLLHRFPVLHPSPPIYLLPTAMKCHLRHLHHLHRHLRHLRHLHHHLFNPHVQLLHLTVILNNQVSLCHLHMLDHLLILYPLPCIDLRIPCSIFWSSLHIDQT